MSKFFRMAAATVSLVLAILASILHPTFSYAKGAGSNPFPPKNTCVPAPGGIRCIYVRTWASTANPKTSPTVILLDGLRATWNRSGWETETDVQKMATHGINVVEPVGGDSSFYTDWNAPSSTNNQRYTYKWESFLTQNLPRYLDTLGFSRNYSLVGLSMGGTAALTLTAHHPDIFRRAASLSGFLHLTSPGFAEAMRLALLSQNGYNLDDMWGPPGTARWEENDPYNLIPALRNTPLWIYSSTGVPDQQAQKNDGPQVIFAGAMLEIAAKSSALDFKERAQQQGLTKVTYHFIDQGIHDWPYWRKEVWDMLGQNFFTRN